MVRVRSCSCGIIPCLCDCDLCGRLPCVCPKHEDNVSKDIKVKTEFVFSLTHILAKEKVAKCISSYLDQSSLARLLGTCIEARRVVRIERRSAVVNLESCKDSLCLPWDTLQLLAVYGSLKGKGVKASSVKALFDAGAGKAPSLQALHLSGNSIGITVMRAAARHFGKQVISLRLSGLVAPADTLLVALPELSFLDIELKRPIPKKKKSKKIHTGEDEAEGSHETMHACFLKDIDPNLTSVSLSLASLAHILNKAKAHSAGTWNALRTLVLRAPTPDDAAQADQVLKVIARQFIKLDCLKLFFPAPPASNPISSPSNVNLVKNVSLASLVLVFKTKSWTPSQMKSFLSECIHNLLFLEEITLHLDGSLHFTESLAELLILFTKSVSLKRIRFYGLELFKAIDRTTNHFQPYIQSQPGTTIQKWLKAMVQQQPQQQLQDARFSLLLCFANSLAIRGCTLADAAHYDKYLCDLASATSMLIKQRPEILTSLDIHVERPHLHTSRPTRLKASSTYVQSYGDDDLPPTIAIQSWTSRHRHYQHHAGSDCIERGPHPWHGTHILQTSNYLHYYLPNNNNPSL